MVREEIKMGLLKIIKMTLACAWGLIAVAAGAATLPEGVTIFDPNIAKMTKVGLPVFLNSGFKYLEAIPSLTTSGGGHGTGVHVGGGMILTNRHVYTEIASLKANTDQFHGFSKIEQAPGFKELFLIKLPKPSAEDSAALASSPGYMRNHRWNTIEKYNDWAVLYDPQLKGLAAMQSFRNASTLKKDETLWVLGRPYGNQTGQIAAGTFEADLGNVSVIKDTDLMGGFSGSPVVDSAGQIVGLIFGFNPVLRKASFMNIETVLKDLKVPFAKGIGSESKKESITSELNYKFIDNKMNQTVIFIHGNGETLESFFLVQKMLPQNFDYLFYDQRGQGQSAYQGTDFKISTMVADLNKLISYLKLKDVHLIGHSFGARIAIAYASAFPKVVRSVVNEDMDFLARQNGSEERIEGMGQQILALNRQYPNINATIEAIRSVYGNDPQLLREILLKSFINNGPGQAVTLLSTPYQSFLWGLFANAVDLGPALKNYQGPVLFLQADQKATAMSAAGIQQILSIRPQALIIPFVGSSHSIHVSMPEKFSQVVGAFLNNPLK